MLEVINIIDELGMKFELKFALYYKNGRKWNIEKILLHGKNIPSFDGWGWGYSSELILEKMFLRMLMGEYFKNLKKENKKDGYYLPNKAINIFVQLAYPFISDFIEYHGDRNIKVSAWIER
jgi:hypothetical protein